MVSHGNPVFLSISKVRYCIQQSADNTAVSSRAVNNNHNAVGEMLLAT